MKKLVLLLLLLLSSQAYAATSVVLRNSSGTEIGDATTPVQVSSANGTMVPGTGATNLGKAEDAVATSGDTGVASLSVGNEAQSTLAADGDYIFPAVDTKGNTLVIGNLANDAVDAGGPVKVGGQARTTNPTAVANADRVNATFDKLGKQIVVPAIRDLKGVQQTTITSSTAETTVVTAIASTFADVYGVIVSNTSATGAAVTFKDATAGTTRFILYVPATDVRGFMLDAGSAIPQATTNANWTATSSASIASLQITMLYNQNT